MGDSPSQPPEPSETEQHSVGSGYRLSERSSSHRGNVSANTKLSRFRRETIALPPAVSGHMSELTYASRVNNVPEASGQQCRKVGMDDLKWGAQGVASPSNSLQREGSEKDLGTAAGSLFFFLLIPSEPLWHAERKFHHMGRTGRAGRT